MRMRKTVCVTSTVWLDTGMDCAGCKKNQWLAKAREVVQNPGGSSSWGGGPYATAPGGGMQMSRDEFKQQLVPFILRLTICRSLL